jgi:hypothetical protein
MTNRKIDLFIVAASIIWCVTVVCVAKAALNREPLLSSPGVAQSLDTGTALRLGPDGEYGWYPTPPAPPSYIVHIGNAEAVQQDPAELQGYLCDLRPAAVFFTGDAYKPIIEGSQEAQFQRLSALTRHLAACGVPLYFVPGNNDYVEMTDDRSSAMDVYLDPPAGAVQKEPGSVANYFTDLSLGGHRYRVMALEYAPRAEVLHWADDVLSAYEEANPDGRAIILTHAWLYIDGERFDWDRYGDRQSYSPHAPERVLTPLEATSDGEELWDALALPHSSVKLVFSGHSMFAHRTDTRPDGTRCYQAAGDYSRVPEEAWFTLYRIQGDDVQVSLVSTRREATGPAAHYSVTVF